MKEGKRNYILKKNDFKKGHEVRMSSVCICDYEGNVILVDNNCIKKICGIMSKKEPKLLLDYTDLILTNSPTSRRYSTFSFDVSAKPFALNQEILSSRASAVLQCFSRTL